MEKNTILAIVLSTIVMIVGFSLQGYFFSPAPQPDVTAVQGQQVIIDTEMPPQVTQPSVIGEASPPETVTAEVLPQAEMQRIPLEYVTVRTETITVVLTNSGGNIVSWKLNDHFDRDDNVDMIFAGTNEAHAFSVAFGDAGVQPVTDNFHVSRISPYIIEFYSDFITQSGTFRLIKRYEFKPSDYMFELTVTLDGGHSIQSFDFSGNAYTLLFGPQIGPVFERLDNRNDYRQYFTYTNGRRRNARVNELIDTRPSWAAISGKYFTFIAIPLLAQYEMTFTETPEPGLSTASRLSIVRPVANISRISDTYRFYLGPKMQDVLARYNTGLNDFGMKDYQLDEIASSRGILSPLEWVLKRLLLFFYGIVRNYGVAIILLTLFVKICFFPLTRKSSEATLRMQALSPRIKEIQEKYKDNPKKMNAEMGAFYQKEGYNPLSGCLPMLLQFPLFIAMYNLFNTHFDLRGAMFIPGWIPDLSIPEAIWNFPDGFTLPLLGWTALRGLPFIYVGSQLIYGRVTQSPGQQSNNQMKMMLYIMPIAFFFILYNVPSGLLIYWIFSNVLTLVQQVIINKYIIKKKEQAQVAEPQPKIAPKKKGKKF